MAKGWKGDSRKHGLARKGIKTKKTPLFTPEEKKEFLQDWGVVTSFMGGAKGISNVLIHKAIKEFGLTDNYYEAGFILPDGSMLDFSGRSIDPYFSGGRERDHREITAIDDDLKAGTNGMIEFMDLTGAIRISLSQRPNYVGIDMYHAPTYAQQETIREFLQITDGNADVELEDGIGEWNAYGETYYSVRPIQKEYEEGTRPQKILADIRRYYE